MKRFSKKDREDAALICAIAACSEESFPLYDEVAIDLDVDEYAPSTALAFAAWGHLRNRGLQWGRALDAEAEALIRTGWCPP